MKSIDLVERGLVPDLVIRAGIRSLCRKRLQEEQAADVALADLRFALLLNQLRSSPIAIETQAANEQHYEVPTEFFKHCLGEHLKYSCCYYPNGDESLDQAEAKMLDIYCERAELADGQTILELGCGWGSLTLWMASRYPNARITAVSNSATQKLHIEATAARRGLTNVHVITADVSTLALPTEQFDRVVSVEMFEHVRNYRSLMQNISSWLKPDGKLFVHIFCHRTLMYPFETGADDDWMGRYFFTGGLMPAADTLLHFQEHLRLDQRWLLDGTHYQRTANQWLLNHDQKQSEILPLLREVYGEADYKVWNQRWRTFWMACAELFGLEGGQQWLVGHYLFAKPTAV